MTGGLAKLSSSRPRGRTAPGAEGSARNATRPDLGCWWETAAPPPWRVCLVSTPAAGTNFRNPALATATTDSYASNLARDIGGGAPSRRRPDGVIWSTRHPSGDRLRRRRYHLSTRRFLRTASIEAIGGGDGPTAPIGGPDPPPPTFALAAAVWRLHASSFACGSRTSGYTWRHPSEPCRSTDTASDGHVTPHAPPMF